MCCSEGLVMRTLSSSDAPVRAAMSQTEMGRLPEEV